MSFAAIDTTQNGCYYALGKNPSNYSGVIFKIDSAGKVIWNKKYSGIFLNTLVSMPDGGFAAGGTSGNFFLMRCDSLGNIIWSWEYDYFLNYESVNSLVRTPDNGFILSFHYYHNSQPIIARIDSAGNVIFCKEFREYSNFSLVYKIQMAADSNYFALLATANNPKVRVIKFDINGNQLWSVGVGDTANASDAMWGEAICATPDGGCLVGGSIVYNQNNRQGNSVCKISPQGSIDWIKTYWLDVYSRSYASALTNTFDNGFIVGSVVGDSLFTQVIETRLTRTDSIGQILWTKKFPTPYSGVSKVIEKGDHGFVLATHIYLSYDNLLIARTDSLGNLLCGGTNVNQTDSTVTLPIFFPNDTVVAHTLDRDSIIVTSDSGIIVLDYCQLITVPDTYNAVAITLYPNPVNTTAAFYTELKVENAFLKIYNIMGVLLYNERIPDLDAYVLSRSSLPDGLYFYELRSANHELIGSGKFIVE